MWQPQIETGQSLVRTNPLVLLVRLAGIEPTTPWFVAKYSIQLSYSRDGAKYTIRTALWVKRRLPLSGPSRLVQVLTGFVNLLPQGFPFFGRQTRRAAIAVLVSLASLIIVTRPWLTG